MTRKLEAGGHIAADRPSTSAPARRLTDSGGAGRPGQGAVVRSGGGDRDRPPPRPWQKLPLLLATLTGNVDSRRSRTRTAAGTVVTAAGNVSYSWCRGRRGGWAVRRAGVLHRREHRPGVPAAEIQADANAAAAPAARRGPRPPASTGSQPRSLTRTVPSPARRVRRRTDGPPEAGRRMRRPPPQTLSWQRLNA